MAPQDRRSIPPQPDQKKNTKQHWDRKTQQGAQRQQFSRSTRFPPTVGRRLLWLLRNSCCSRFAGFHDCLYLLLPAKKDATIMSHSPDSSYPHSSCWEVEQKYAVDGTERWMERLRGLDATELAVQRQVDTYWRDFRATDEAFRIRQIDQAAVVTYKGARLPGGMKTRPEVELPLAPGTVEGWQTILQSLGFEVARQVSKTRRTWQVMHHRQTFTLARDQVDQLGCFVEIELLVHSLDDRPLAEQQIASLATWLGLDQPVTRSYLGMLLDRDAQAGR
jgi:adenylate cyclase class 2